MGHLIVVLAVVFMALSCLLGIRLATLSCEARHGTTIGVPADRDTPVGPAGKLRVEGGWVVRVGERLVFVPDRTEPQEF